MAEEGRDMVCQLCGHGSELQNVAGQLHSERLDSGRHIAAHHRCMQYSSGLTQFKCPVFGGFEVEEVDQEICRGSKLSCFICRKTRGRSVRGASCGCAVKSCRKSFHYPCAHTHPDTITKRLVVTKSKQNPDDKFVMYRVFCSPEHEVVFRKALRQDLRRIWRDESSEENRIAELRGSRKKTGRKKNEENHEESCGSVEVEASLQEDGQSSGEDERNSDEGGASPITNGSLNTSCEMLTDSSVLTDSPAVSSAHATHNSDEEGGVVSRETGDTSVTDTTTCTVEIIALSSVTGSGQPGKQTPARSRSRSQTRSRSPARSLGERPARSPCQTLASSRSPDQSPARSRSPGDTPARLRSPGQTPARSRSPGQTRSPARSRSPGQTPARSPGTKADVSQPLLCRLTEELSTIHNNDNDDNKDVRNKHTKDVEEGRDDACPFQNGWHPHCDLSDSPGEESVENKSPENKSLAKTVPQRVVHVLTECLVSVEKVSVLQAHTDNTAKPQPGVVVQKGSVLQAHSDNSQPAGGQKKVAPSSPTSPVNCKKAIPPSSATGQSSSGNKSGKLSTAKNSTPKSHAPSQGKTVQHTKSEKSGGKVGDKVESPKHSKAGEVQDKDSVNTSSNNDAHAKVADVSESRTVSDDSTVVAEVRADLSVETGSCAGQNQGCRKRRRRESDRGQTSGEPVPKVSKEDVPTVCDLPLTDSVLLIPSHMEQFEAQEGQVRQAVAEQLGEGGSGLWVWQRMTSRLQGSIPSPLMLLFMLDLIRELEKENNTAVLDMLFDTDTLTTRVNSYLIAQEHVFHRVGEGIQQTVESALWSSVECSVECLPMLHLVRGHSGLATLALSVRHFTLSQHLTAHIQAYCGLFRWTEDTEVQIFPLTQRHQGIAAQREAMALKFWLTGVNPVSEVTVLPSDDLFYDKTHSAANAVFFQLANYLKEKTLTTPVVVEGGEPVQHVTPLLVFQPVDVFLVSFPEYFQRACDKFLHDRGLMSGLVLVPLSNLYTQNCRTITGLLCGGEGESGEEEGGRYRVSVYSAFCPVTQPVTMVLLEITCQQTENTAQVTESRPALQNSAVVKRKRGRPRKTKS